MTIYYSDDRVTLYHGDALEILAPLPENSIDAICTDPPYGLEFMGKDWDRPWAVSPTNGVGYAGRDVLTLPAHRDNRNANCRGCGGRQRGAKRCECPAPQWDRDPAADMRAFQEWCQLWATECLRVLKPGGHMLSFGGTRTFHRLACAIEDAGFEIRDSIAWLYGSGFPKSLDVSKAIDKAAGADVVTRPRFNTVGDVGAGNARDGYAAHEQHVGQTAAAREWSGWGTALKPAFEPIVVARKPLSGTVAGNVQAYGTGALNIDACRVGLNGESWGGNRENAHTDYSGKVYGQFGEQYAKPSNPAGRWPANVVLDGGMADELDKQSGVSRDGVAVRRNGASAASFFASQSGRPAATEPLPDAGYGGEGGASRFFPTFRYSAKAATTERPTADGVAHPTVKPLDLMRWLIRLVTPPHGTVLDPFAGSGTTGEAAIHEHMHAVLIEREPTYLPLIVARLSKPMAVGFDFEEEPA